MINGTTVQNKGEVSNNINSADKIKLLNIELRQKWKLNNTVQSPEE